MMGHLNPERDRIWLLSRELMLAAERDGMILAINPSWTAALGWEEAELRTMKFLDLVHPEDVPVTEESAFVATGTAAGDLENRCRHKNGSYCRISWSTIGDGKLVYAIGRPVSPGGNSAGLHDHAEDVNRGEKIDAASRFAGIIAHDFNNHLQGIAGSLELVRKLIKLGRLEETDRFIDTAMTSLKRAAAMTGRLHVFSSRQPSESKEVEVDSVINSSENLLRSALGPSIELKLVLCANSWLTVCDPNQLENALLNLVTNARDAMPQGGTVVIESSAVTLAAARAVWSDSVAPGQYIRIAVTDTGAGMSEETLRQAFDPLFTTKPAGQAAGLGLSMVFGFARRQQGYVRMTSELERGTTLKLYLPRSQGHDATSGDKTLEQ